MLAYILSYLFTPSGRFRRVDYHLVVWSVTFFIFALIMGIFGFVMSKGLGSMLGPTSLQDMKEGTGDAFGLDVKVVVIGGLVLYVMSYVAVIMATIKRFHDFGMTGWYTLLLYFPLPLFLLMALMRMMDWHIAEMVLSAIWLLAILWYTIKLMFFKGLKADNFYGPDPYIETPPYTGQALTIIGVMFLVAVGACFASYTSMMEFKAEYQKRSSEAQEKAKAPLTSEERAAKEALEKKRAEEARQREDARTLELANQGDADAQYNIAGRYFTGSNGVPLDYTKAGAWLQKAAEQDHAAAQYNLGLLYYEGKGYAVDNGRAYFWATRASFKGHIPQGNDYRAQAGQLLTAEMRAQIEKAAHAWKPVVKAALVPTPMPPQPATSAPAATAPQPATP